jgi:predicted Zn-dependent protease
VELGIPQETCIFIDKVRAFASGLAPRVEEMEQLGSTPRDVILDCGRVGLTGMDLYVPRLNFVFGLALRREGLAVVSWHRLRDGREVLVARLAKEVIHEVGHLEGLDHCLSEFCVMRFSNTLAETDEKGLDFCQACARKRR